MNIYIYTYILYNICIRVFIIMYIINVLIFSLKYRGDTNPVNTRYNYTTYIYIHIYKYIMIGDNSFIYTCRHVSCNRCDYNYIRGISLVEIN